LYLAVQVPLTAVPAVTVQVMAGERPDWLVMVPLPVPLPVTLSVYLGVELPANLALTVRFTFMVTVQLSAVPNALQEPPQPLKVLPGSGTTVSVTTVL
jgi:hypothetical protein